MSGSFSPPSIKYKRRSGQWEDPWFHVPALMTLASPPKSNLTSKNGLCKQPGHTFPNKNIKFNVQDMFLVYTR